MAVLCAKTAGETKKEFGAVLLVVFGFTLSTIIGVALCGCSTIRYIPPEKLSYEELSAPYASVQLKISNTLDVLGKIRSPESVWHQRFVERQLLSQSDTVVASSGKSKDGYKIWLNMFAFDEHTMTATRKCFFCVDEKAVVTPTKPKRYLIPPRHGLIIDCQVVLESEMLAKPYSTEEARRVEVLKSVAQALCKDMDELAGDVDKDDQTEDMLAISAMMINQVFEAVLFELDRSPGAAASLSDEQGISFSHITFDKSRIRMIVNNDIVTVKIRIGYPMQ
jgi:hypothetical protein